jgi:alkylation response protein AidB-like acyl-CoA dehydrogenase
MTTRADRKGDRYVLNGKKHWITGGGVSRLHLIFARVVEDGVEQGIGGFIVVRDPGTSAPNGLVVGKREPAMGVRGLPETEIVLDHLEVARDMVVIPPAAPGRPASDNGGLCHGVGGPEGGGRCRRALMLTILAAGLKEDGRAAEGLKKSWHARLFLF